jgi:hypothetical protein
VEAILMTWTFYNAQGQEKRATIVTPADAAMEGVATGGNVTVAAAWIRLPLGPVASQSAAASDCLRYNADGTVTILQTGWYNLVSHVQWSASTGGQIQGWWSDATDTTPGTIPTPFARTEIQSSNATAMVICSTVEYITAGTRLGVGAFNRTTSGVAFCQRWTVARVSGVQGPPGPSTPIPLVSSLPGSPVPGQEVYYRCPNAPWPLWHLRYSGGWGDGFEWDFLGGAPLRSTVNTDETFAAGTTYVDSATVGPQITLPLGGDYTYSFSAHIYIVTQTAGGTLSVGLSLAGAQPAIPDIASEYAIAGTPASVGRNGALLAQPSGRVVKMVQQLAVALGGTPHTRMRELQMTPVRVG